ncbi:MAG: hypothetical protein LAN37_06270 [Acidobacteriia bacterium]|nr:hypothetical protein [Terriglobia bacterium]
MGDAGSAYNEVISGRLKKTTSELRDIQQLLTNDPDLDVRVLFEFREAVNHVRHTAWAVEQWLRLKVQKGDTFSVLSMLAIERVRIACELSTGLLMDLEASEVTPETEGMEKLVPAVKRLAERFKSMGM